MKKLKKYLCVLCAFALTAAFAGCKKSDSKDYSNQTIRGQVTEISGNKVTLKIGGMPSFDGQQPPNMPGGQNSSQDSNSTQNSDAQTSVTPPSADSQNSQNGGTPPAPPQGSNSQNGSGNQPPAPPKGSNGNQNGGNNQPPKMPSGEKPSGFGGQEETATFDLSNVSITKNDEQISVSDITSGDMLEITFGDKNKITSAKVMTMSAGGGSQQEVEGNAANTISEDGTIENKEYASTGKDENALLIDGATVTLDSVKVDKSAGESSSPENGDFYGINAALLAKNGANVTINNAKITSSAQNGNGIFSYGSGTKVAVSDTTITTTADNSGGIQTAGGGGTVEVTGGNYTSNGYNSPAIYSTANITAKNAALKATNSEAIVIEGKNSVALDNCTVEGNMSSTKGSSSDENVHNIMIYQSMSGDAEEGTSSFSAKDGTITSNNGDFIYVTNTKCTIDLTDVNLVNNSKSGNLLTVSGNSASKGWGSAGSNGGDATFTASNQKLEGAIAVDSISKLNMTLKNNSSFTGTINITENSAGTAVSDNAVITIESGSTWNLTGDCKISSLNNSGTINYNGHSITLADGTALKA